MKKDMETDRDLWPKEFIQEYTCLSRGLVKEREVIEEGNRVKGDGQFHYNTESIC